jgi:hypothetical protein
MICVPIKEKVGPPTNTINHLSVPNNTMESQSPGFPRKIGLTPKGLRPFFPKNTPNWPFLAQEALANFLFFILNF